MSKVKKRKARPQPPRWYWIDTDCCYGCENTNNCNGCHILKEYISLYQKFKRKKKINYNERTDTTY